MFPAKFSLRGAVTNWNEMGSFSRGGRKRREMDEKGKGGNDWTGKRVRKAGERHLQAANLKEVS